MKIAVFTLPYELANEANKINQLFQNGLEELHFRKIDFSKADYVKVMNAIHPQYHNRIVLHQHFGLIHKFSVKGIHIPRNYFQGFMGKIRKIILGNTSNIQISTTVNSLKSLQKVEGDFDGVWLGPLYQKYSEENIRSKFDSFELKKVLNSCKYQIFAMGGIDLSNKNRLQSLGFAGIVLQSSIWKSDNIVNALTAFQLAQYEASSESTAKVVG